MDGGGVLETARLRLRPWAADDLDPLVVIFAEAEVWRYPFGEGLSRERTVEFLNGYLGRQAEGEPVPWAVEEKASGRLIGYIGLAVPHWLPQVLPAVEVGYRLHPQWWGRGLATEGAAASLQYGFDVLRLDRILAMCDPANHASRRVMQRLGMTYLRSLDVPGSTKVVEVHELTSADRASAGAVFPDGQ